MKILIWAMARALGDGVIYTGYPREIKKIYPDAEIHIFSTKMYAAAFKNNPNVDKFYFFNTYNKPFNKITRTKIFLNPVFHLKNLLKARHEKYDILIDVDSSYKWSNRFMIRFIMGGGITSSKLYGAVAGKFRENNKYKYDKKFLYKTYTHLFSSFEGSAYSIINPDIDKYDKYELYIPKHKENKAREYFKQTADNNKIIIFNGEGSDKSLSNDKIVETLTKLINAYPEYHFFIIGYSDYIEKYQLIAKDINSPHLHITYKTDIQDTFALIQAADLLISVDTALVHIASAVGTNVCEIISYGKKDYVIGTPRFVEFIQCANKTQEYNQNGFDIDDIINAVSKLI